MKSLKNRDYTNIIRNILRILFVIQLCISVYNKEYRSIIVCVLGFIFTFSVNLLEKIKEVYTPKLLKLGLLLLITLTFYLGETHNFYDVIPFYDKSIHVFAGVLFTYFGLYLSYILNKNYINNKINKYYVLLFAILFSVAIAVFWEFVEFTDDRLFNDNAQRWKSGYEAGLFDTMYDLITNTSGSTISLGFGIWYIKKYKDIFFKRLFTKR